MTEVERAKAAEDARILRDADLAGVMSTQGGRRFVWRILDELSGTLNGSYVSDSHATAFNEGKRAVGLALTLELQRVAPGPYVHMLSEHLASQRAEEARREQEAKDDG